MRVRVTNVGAEKTRCITPEGEEIDITFAATPFEKLSAQLRIGDELSLLDCPAAVQGVIHPTLVILEPNFLVDVTALCSCYKDYGFHAANALLAKFDARSNTLPIQLGNLANELFDDCIQSESASTEDETARKGRFHRVVTNSFRRFPLVYTALQGIDRDFFLRADSMHINICRSKGALPAELMIEPSFVCPDLGLQGRMDALSYDRHTIVELKSGKCDEWRRDSKCKREHEMQMILYSEMLHYGAGLPRHAVQCLLFYCQYPLLAKVSYTIYQVQKIMAVRNDLVHQERLLSEGRGREIMQALTEDDFNTTESTGKFYDNYCRPIINRFLSWSKGMDELTAAYFHAFTAFLEREQWIAKTNAYQGEVLRGLRLTPMHDTAGAIISLNATLPADIDTNHDFRVGDMVVLFKNEGVEDLPWKHQFFRAYITFIDTNQVQLALAYRQSSDKVFDLNATYAMTAGYMDSGFSTLYHGMMTFANASDQRRTELLWGRGDFQLLIGPPGTGKTSVALRDMVKGFLQEGKTLLLMAYTNQAVDEICTMLAPICPEYIRIGNENACAIQHRTRMMQNVMAEAANRNDIKRILAATHVYVGTISSISACNELFALCHFDVTIVDEASQVLEPHIVPLLCRVGKFILIGDHKQLPAVVIQPKEDCVVTDPRLNEIGLYNLSESYFERLLRLDRQNGGSNTSMLVRQGRMHADIMAFPNQYFYGGRLQTVPLPHQHEASSEPRLVFCDVPYNGCQALKSNPAEADVVAEIVCQLKATPNSIGIIVPFRAQIATIRAALAEAKVNDYDLITIDTVERYQGSQRDYIIYCTCVTQPEQLDTISVEVETEDGFVDRKLNVAVTRARLRFFMVGCRRILMRSNLYANLILSCKAVPWRWLSPPR